MKLTAAAVRIHCRYQIVVTIGTVQQNYTKVRSKRFLLNVLKCFFQTARRQFQHTLNWKNRREKFGSQRVTKCLSVEIQLNRDSLLCLIIAACHFLSAPLSYWHGAHSRPPHVRPSSGGKWKVTVVRQSDILYCGKAVGAQGKCPCLREMHAPKRRCYLSEDLNLQQQRCEKSNIPTVCLVLCCFLWSRLGSVLQCTSV